MYRPKKYKMKVSAMLAVVFCLALGTGTLASAVTSQPSPDEEPGVMRMLQGVLSDHYDGTFVKQSVKAADAVKGVVVTKVEGVQRVASRVGDKAAKEAQQVFKADAKVLHTAATAVQKSFQSSGQAIAATGAAIRTGAVHLVTAPFGGFSHAAQKASQNAKKETQQAIKKAAKGVKKVKRAVAKAKEARADAFEETAEAAARAVKRAAMKDDIAKKVAAMKVGSAVDAGFKAVLKP